MPPSVGTASIEQFRRDVASLTAADLGETLLVGSYLRAIEGLVEFAKHDPRSGPARPIEPDTAIGLLETLDSAGASPEVRAFAATLAGRALVLAEKRGESIVWFERALELSSGVGPGPDGYLDWLAPANLAARVQIEYIRAVYPMAKDPKEVLTRIGMSLPEPDSIDADRLGSAILILRSAVGAVPMDELGKSPPRSETSLPGPRVNVHAALPRRSIVEAQALVAAGDVVRGTAMLQDQQRDSEVYATEGLVLVDSRKATLRVARRMRLADQQYIPYQPLLSSTDMDELFLAWPLAGLDRHSPGMPLIPEHGIPPEFLSFGPDAALDHARWRGMFALHDDLAREAVAWGWARSESNRLRRRQIAAPSYFHLCWQLDEVEVDRIAALHEPGPSRLQPDPRGLYERVLAWIEAHPEQPVEALTLLLRGRALELDSAMRLQVIEGNARRVGLRRAAEIALDEGELLALRLPGQAISLLREARSWFRSVKDHVGAVLASTCCALCLARLDRRDPLKGEISTLGEEFEKMRRSSRALSSNLPAWNALLKTARQLDPPSLGALSPREWRPWLVRMLACLVKGEQASERLQRLAHWVASSKYGTHLADGSPLPAELDGWLAPVSRRGGVLDQSPGVSMALH